MSEIYLEEKVSHSTHNPISAITENIFFQESDTPVLALYYRENCPFCKKIFSFLKNLGRTIPCNNLDQNPKAEQDLLNIGGNIQVPCLFIDGKPLYESEAIIAWLKSESEKKKTK